MKRLAGLGTVTLAAALAAAPALAQSSQPSSHPTIGPDTPGVATPGTNGTSTASTNPGTQGLTNRSTVNPGIAAIPSPYRNPATAPSNAEVAPTGTPSHGAKAPAAPQHDPHPQATQPHAHWDNIHGKNPALTKDGLVRAEKILHAPVYNRQNRKIGTIDDILLTQDGHPAKVVVRLQGGVLASGSKLVAVPFKGIQVSNANPHQRKVILTQVSGSSLSDRASYAYDSSNKDSGLKPDLKKSIHGKGQYP